MRIVVHNLTKGCSFDDLIARFTQSCANSVNLPKAHLSWLDTVLPILQTLNFVMNRPGKKVVAVHGVTVALKPLIQTGNTLDAIEEAHHSLRPNATPGEMREQLTATFACQTAILAGDS